MNEAVLEFQGVSFAYGETVALEGVSFAVRRGEFLALVGPNGGGKTTLLRLALGLERPGRGRVLLFGTPVPEFREWHRVGYVPQTAGAFQVRFPATVAEVVSFGEYRGPDPLAFFRRGVSPAVRRALERVGLWELRDRPINQLSVGQRQRALIARALVHDPELLIMDEPTAGVDALSKGRIYELLQDMRSRSLTVVLVSHDVGVVFREATRLACLNRTLISLCAPDQITDEDLRRTYGLPVGLVLHRHD